MKADTKTRLRHYDFTVALEEQKDKLNKAIESYNNTVSDAYVWVVDELETYNNIASQAEEFLSDLAESVEEKTNALVDDNPLYEETTECSTFVDWSDHLHGVSNELTLEVEEPFDIAIIEEDFIADFKAAPMESKDHKDPMPEVGVE